MPKNLRKTLALDILIALALVLGGLATRWPYMELIPRYDDEVVETLYALDIRPGGFMPLVNIDTYNGPMFSYLLAGSLYVATHPVTPRVLVMILGALTVGATFGLARALGLGRPWAALAGLLMMVNPVHIVVNSHLASSSYIVPLFSTAFLAALVMAVRRESGPWLIAAGFLLGLTGQAHPVAALMLPGVAIWFLFRHTSSIGFRSRWPYLAVLVFLIVYSPIIIHSLQSPSSSVQEVTQRRAYAWGPVQSPDAYVQNAWHLALQLSRQIGGVLSGNETLSDLIGLALLYVAWAIAGLIYSARQDTSLLALAVASQVISMPAVSSYYGMLLPTRYTAQLIPVTVIAMAVLAERAWRLTQPSPRITEARPRSLAWVWRGAIAALIVILSLLPLIQLSLFYQDEVAANRTAAPYYAFYAEVMRQWHGESILISDSLGRFNPTEYLFATNRVPYRYMPLGRIMERLATGQETGSAILILDESDVRPVRQQADLIAWDTPAMRAAREIGYGAYRIADAQGVRKPTFVFTDTALGPTMHAVQADLANRLGVIGYEIRPARPVAGDELIVNVHWQALAAMSEAYTGFLHLVGPDGRLVTQDDHELGRGFYRTLYWQPGEVVREKYTLALPKELSAGEYALRAGVYSFPSLQRLTVKSSSVPTQDNTVTLGMVQVGP